MVGILYISDLRGCPFIGRYIDALEDENIEYKIILWNRECGDGQTEESGHVIEFKYFQDTRISKKKKAKGFLKYMRFLNNQIKTHQFDKLIVLCTLTGMLVFGKLMKRYRGKFIFDIRDISFENIRLFNHLEKKLIDHSYFTSYSSDGFLQLLPKSEKLCFCPNIEQDTAIKLRNAGAAFSKKNYGDKLNLVYVGAVRQYENVRLIIDTFGNSPLFEIYYHGAGDVGYKDVISYVKEKDYRNVHFTGKYDNSERINLLKDADILNNFYVASKDMKYANTNKYLDGIMCHIPLFGNLETHDGILSRDEGIGLSYSGIPDPQRLYDDYFLIDEAQFNASCAQALNKNLVAEDDIKVRIKEFLSGEL